MKDVFAGYWRYEVVVYRGDDIIETGTIRQIAEKWNVQKRYIYWLTMPTAHRRADSRKNKSTGLRAIRV